MWVFLMQSKLFPRPRYFTNIDSHLLTIGLSSFAIPIWCNHSISNCTTQRELVSFMFLIFHKRLLKSFIRLTLAQLSWIFDSYDNRVDKVYAWDQGNTKAEPFALAITEHLPIAFIWNVQDCSLLNSDYWVFIIKYLHKKMLLTSLHSALEQLWTLFLYPLYFNSWWAKCSRRLPFWPLSKFLYLDLYFRMHPRSYGYKNSRL